VVVAVGAVGRHVDFAWAEREPADRRAALLAERDAKFGAADEGHQRRRVDRLQVALRGHPEPALAALGPAAVIVGRGGPRRLGDPGPAIDRIGSPAAGAVGRPAGRRVAHVPDLAVLRIVLPGAVVVEVLVAGDAGRQVLRRLVVDDHAVALR